jgi:hypothetical protein
MSSSRERHQLLERLLDWLKRAPGCDGAIDQAIARDLAALLPGTPAPAYTASVDRCLELLHQVLPGWHWHLGYGASGVLPYAFVAGCGRRFEAAAPTVPLALLIVLTEARIALEAVPSESP